MAWSSLTITRDDIDAFEKQSFRDLNITSGNTVLNLDEDDNLMLDKAKDELESDVIDKMQDLVLDSTYATDTALLDAIEAVNKKGWLENLLTYKFLELWFRQDATHQESKAMSDARYYNRKYTYYLPINLKRLAGDLASPKSVPRYQMRSSYA